MRSTDLLSLANVNPDSAFAVQMSIDDSLADSSLACFQAALLYTSSKGTDSHAELGVLYCGKVFSRQTNPFVPVGKRRIRVHTLCLPVVSQLSDVYAGADVQAITCLLANMGTSAAPTLASIFLTVGIRRPYFNKPLSAIDRSISSSLSDARDALVNAVVDLATAYKSNVSNLQQSGLVVPAAVCLFPLYIHALLKQVWPLQYLNKGHEYDMYCNITSPSATQVPSCRHSPCVISTTVGLVVHRVSLPCPRTVRYIETKVYCTSSVVFYV